MNQASSKRRMSTTMQMLLIMKGPYSVLMKRGCALMSFQSLSKLLEGLEKTQWASFLQGVPAHLLGFATTS